MVFQLTIKITERNILVGAPSSQWWTQLSSTIAGGLAFATVLTLVATPAMLVIGDRLARFSGSCRAGLAVCCGFAGIERSRRLNSAVTRQVSSQVSSSDDRFGAGGDGQQSAVMMA